MVVLQIMFYNLQLVTISIFFCKQLDKISQKKPADVTDCSVYTSRFISNYTQSLLFLLRQKGNKGCKLLIR